MPDTTTRYALRGRIVTMDAQDPAATDTVIKDGVIYIDGDVIAAITAPKDPPPAGFENCPRVDTGGTIYPGLMELHNHLSYNILPMWNVSGTYQNNGDWRSAPDKGKFITGPMKLLNQAKGYLGAIVRYVETKCMIAGVTTSQGLTLIDAGGIPKKYVGIVRNCEEPDHPDLPKAAHRIDDVNGTDPISPQDLRKKLDGMKGSYLLHLAEGLDEEAHGHFTALEFPDHSDWAISDALVGIHSAGLHPDDFPIFKQHGGSMVWSPLSNMMLYGGTAQVQAAKDSGILMALGSDWSPSGSKNLLAELKIAKLYSQQNGNIFTDVELVRMVTSNPARMLKWGAHLGSIEKGKLADLVVMGGKAGDPYKKLLTSDEMDVRLVVIGGVPRYGTTSIMAQLNQDGEKVTITSHQQSGEWVMNLAGAPDNAVRVLTYKEAHDKLLEGLAKLPTPPSLPVIAMGAADADAAGGSFSLLLDNDDEEGYAARALGPLSTADVLGDLWAEAVDYTKVVLPVILDELTVAENRAKYVGMLTQQKHLKEAFKDKVKKPLTAAQFEKKVAAMYGAK